MALKHWSIVFCPTPQKTFVLQCIQITALFNVHMPPTLSYILYLSDSHLYDCLPSKTLSIIGYPSEIENFGISKSKEGCNVSSELYRWSFGSEEWEFGGLWLRRLEPMIVSQGRDWKGITVGDWMITLKQQTRSYFSDTFLLKSFDGLLEILLY